MLGYDFDGVIMSDVLLPEDATTDMYHHHRDCMGPIFTPPGDYFFITSRPEIYRANLEAYISKFMQRNPPKMVFMRPSLDDDPLKYKAHTLKDIAQRESVEAFIESDLQTYTVLAEAVPYVNVIHFEDFILSNLYHLEKDLTRKIYGLLHRREAK